MSPHLSGLNELLQRWQAARREGRDLPAEELCRESPELLSQVSEALERLRQDATLLDAGANSGHALTAAPDSSRTHGSTPVLAVEGGPHSLPMIPGFTLERELGRGGMGVVYLATQERLHRPVALKMILAGSFANADARRRFLLEAQTLAKIQHPHVIQIHECGEHDGKPYYVLEYVAGGSLHAWLSGKPVPPRAAAALVEKLARGVHAAHLGGVLHRDLKPANVLLDVPANTPVHLEMLGQVCPKISDFGLAKLMDSPTGLTKTGQVLGTPEYMAPEQASGIGPVGPTADVYALGAILYELLTGRPPHRGQTLLETIALVLADEPMLPSRLVPSLPRDLVTICNRCLRMDPSKRYASAADLADDLRRYLGNVPIAARSPGSFERAVRWCRRYPAVAALLLVTALAATTATGLATWALSAQRQAQAERDEKEYQRLRAEENERRANGERDRAEAERAKEEQQRRYAEAIAAFIRDDFLALTSVEGQERFAKSAADKLGKDATLLQLLDRAAVKLDQRQDMDPIVEADLRWMIAVNYRGMEEYRKAAANLRRCIALREQHLGPDHRSTISALNSLSAVYGSMGDYRQGLELVRTAYERAKRALGPNDPGTLTFATNLAQAYIHLDRPNEALPLLQQIAEGRLRDLGDRHPRTWSTQNSLANNFMAVGRMAEAIELLERVRAVQRQASATDQLEAINTLCILGQVYHKAGRLWDATAVYEEARDVSMRKLGQRHRLTLSILGNLARVYSENGRPTDAVKILEDVVAVTREIFGPDHPSLVIARCNLASALLHLNRHRDAAELAERTHADAVRLLGPDHSHALSALNVLATAYWHLNEFNRSIPAFEKLVNVYASRLGRQHPTTQNSVANLGINYRDAGRLQDALPLLQEAQRSSQHDQSLTWVALELVDCQLRMGQREEALQVGAAWIARARSAPRSGSSVVAARLANLGLLLLSHGLAEPAEPLLREALDLWLQQQPPAVVTHEVQIALGQLLSTREQWTEAEPLLLAGFAGLKSRTDLAPRAFKYRRDAVEELIKLYRATQRPEEVHAWEQQRLAP